jgi:hypothetical protein
LRLKAPLQLVQRLLQSVQIGIIAAAIGQVHVQIARLFAEREISRPVQRQREHRVVAPEDAGRAVALVNIQVDHRHP